MSPIPGASAAVSALSASGISSTHFLFYGFLPPRAAERRKELAGLASHPFALVFFEAPHRILESVADMTDLLGAERQIVIARELTKLFEDIHSCPLGEAVDWLAAEDVRRKGEFVLVVAGAAPKAPEDESVQHALEALLAELPLKQAVSLAAKITGTRRNRVYEIALAMTARESGTPASKR